MSCHLFLLSLENPYSGYFQIFAVCILALGNLPGNFFLRFSVSPTKSKMAAKILWRTLEHEPLHRFVSCLVKGRELKSFWCDSDDENFTF